MRKKYGRYEDHPHVITGAPRPHVERFRLTPDAFAARYRRLTPVECPEGSSIIVTVTDGVARYIVEVPALLIHEGYRSGAGGKKRHSANDRERLVAI